MERGGSFGYYDNWASRDPYGYSRKHPSAEGRAGTQRGDYPMDTHQHNHIGMEGSALHTAGSGFASESSKNAGNHSNGSNFDAPIVASSGKLWENQEHNNSQTSSQQQQQQKQKKRSNPIQRIFRRFAERCSMQGPPYIYASTWWFPRLAWTLFLLAALGVMSYHLIYLCKTYFAWPTKNKLYLGFSSLQFPAVTICNVNPIRASKLNTMSEDLQKFVKDIDPDTLGGAIDKQPTGQSTGRRRRDTSEEEGGDNDGQLDDWNLVQLNRSASNLREDYDRDEAYKNLKGYTNSWEKEGKQSAFSSLESVFLQLYAAENRGKRVKAGHQLKDMLQSCSFAGKSCYPQNFTLITNTKFGNCYTLQYNKFISRDSGPSGGLELLLFLDTEEYIRGVTPDDGLQVSVHPQMTVPFPMDDGVAVAAGAHTKLSLRLVQIERKSQPYGDCTSPSVYNEQYNLSYSKQLCLRFCLQENVIGDCSCRDETEDDVNILMNATSNKPCRNKQEVQCLQRTRWKYQSGDISCQCFNPCSESKYEKSMSSRPWPNKEYALNILVKAACRRLTSEKCQRLKSKDAHLLSREFVKLNIFYEDLNYENITEEPDYETVQFVSDIGGTLGLWIGLSVLSMLEVLQLAGELIAHLCCCCLKTRKIK